MWLSSSFISCKVSAGLFSSRGQIVTSGIGVGSSSESFSFDTAQAFASAMRNGASTGSLLISVTGENFGTVGFTISERIGDSAAENSRWLSYTSLICKVLRLQIHIVCQIDLLVCRQVQGSRI